ncbi:Lethal(2) giant larvae sro7 [Cryptotrichosporon argae]
MFKAKGPALASSTDFSGNLRETSFYKYGHLRSLGLSGEITALAVDPVSSLLAVGLSSGLIHVFGAAPVHFVIPAAPASSSGPARSIAFLFFHPGHGRVVAIDAGNTFHQFSLRDISDSANPNVHPPTPVREAGYTVYGTVTAAEQPLPSHTHMFVAMRDGQTIAWDLKAATVAGFKVHNCWAEYEQRLIRSGVPGRGKTIGGPTTTCLAHNPRDLNVLLIGYDGGVVAWDFQKAAAVKTYEMTLPPGAPGGGTYQDADGSLWTERTPSVTSIAWRPDGLVFAVGHSDGCISFWAYSESDKPLMVRTLTHEDVHVTDAESLLSAGALDTQVRRKDAAPAAVSANREPIYKLAWASFPDQAALKLLVAAQGTDKSIPPPTNATVEYADRGETLLLVLGGQSPGERPGINILQMPAYLAPMAKRPTSPTSPSQSMPLQERYAFRDSLAPTGTSNYPTRTPPEDFVLVPRTNPYFSMAHDAVAIIITLTPDATMPPPPGPSAEREFEVYAFPPPRSSTAPPPLGRKSFLVPGEGERLVALTPAPMSPSSPSLTSPRSPSPASWRFPWSAQSSPSISGLLSPSLIPPSPRLAVNERKRFRAPSSLWSGAYAVMGCEMFSLPTPTFKRLISWSIEVAGNETFPRLPIYGGLAVPDLQSQGAPDLKVLKMESYRVLVTHHPDATVRFWDASPHILVLPTPLRFEFPAPLPHLTISVGEYLKHPDVAHLPLAKLWATDRRQVRITGVHLARESLECVITLATGEVVVTKFGESKPAARGDGNEVEELELDGWAGPAAAPATPRSESYFPSPTYPGVPRAASPLTPGTPHTSQVPGSPGSFSSVRQDWVDEVTELDQLAKWATDGFKPVCILTSRRGEAVACAVSDIGFVAVAYATKTLTIMDLRGPEIILREGFDEDGEAMRKRKKKGNAQNVLGEHSLVGCLKWVVSGLGADPTPRPRLIVSYAKGMTKIYTLVNVLGEWLVEPKPPTFTNDSLAGPLATFVLDAVNGNELAPSAESLSAAMAMQNAHDAKTTKDKDAPPHCLWIAASKRSIRCAVNFNGERVAKVELENEELSDVKYITRHGNRVIVALTTTGSALFHTAPHLEYITRMDLYFGGEPRKIGRLSFDDRSGDFVEYGGPLDVSLRTLFHFRKPLPPRYDPLHIKHPVPPQPAPLNASTLVGSWIWGGAALSGAQLDSIVAGPSRPQPAKPVEAGPPKPKKPLITWGEPPDEPVVAKAALSPVAPKRVAVGKQRGPARDARERNDAYSEMQDTLAERTDVLDYLGEQLNNASVSASGYLSAARNTAMKEAAKGTAKGMLGKLL